MAFEKSRLVVKQISHRSDQGVYYRGLPIRAAPGVHEHAFELLSKHLPPPAQVMELGAGSGAFASRLVDAGYKVNAVDTVSIDWKLTSVPLAELDLNRPIWDMPKGHYDALVAIEVLEHLENPSSFFRNARDLLKPGGILFFTVPNVLSVESRRKMLIKGELAFFGKGALYASGHLTVLPYWLLEDILEKERYEVLDRSFSGKQSLVFRPNRAWWKFAVAPLVDLLLLLVGREVPAEAAFNSNVAFIATPSRELQT
jgi:SAM-dependent methyltransferase